MMKMKDNCAFHKLSKFLRENMEENDISVCELALESGVSEATVRALKYGKGEEGISFDNIHKIFKALDIDIEIVDLENSEEEIFS